MLKAKNVQQKNTYGTKSKECKEKIIKHKEK